MQAIVDGISLSLNPCSMSALPKQELREELPRILTRSDASMAEDILGRGTEPGHRLREARRR